MQVVCDARDAAVLELEPNGRRRLPLICLSPQDDYNGLGVHIAHGQTLCDGPPIVVPEVRRVDQPAGEPVRHAQPGIGSDEFTEPVPVASIESLDVEVQ